MHPRRSRATGVCYNIPVVNKHFFKVLTVFSIMIILGLIGVFLVSFFDPGNNQSTEADTVVN